MKVSLKPRGSDLKLICLLFLLLFLLSQICVQVYAQAVHFQLENKTGIGEKQGAEQNHTGLEGKAEKTSFNLLPVSIVLGVILSLFLIKNSLNG